MTLGNAIENTLVILNPISGNGSGAGLWPSIETILRDGGLDFDLERTTEPRQAVALAERAKHDGYETLIAVGGDGTVNEVVNGMLRASKGDVSETLGIIPVGSGNDFVKMLAPARSAPGGLQPSWRESAMCVLAGETRLVDVGKVVGDKPMPGFPSGPHYFVNGLDTGFGARVAAHVRDMPFLQSTSAYLVAVLKTLANYSLPRVKIDLDGTSIEMHSTMVAVSNGRCYGGGFWVTPTAQVDDGLFDLMIAQALGRIGILGLLPKIMRGTHVTDSRVRMAQARRVVIQSPDALMVESDGEIPYIGAHRLEIEILSKCLRVIA